MYKMNYTTYGEFSVVQKGQVEQVGKLVRSMVEARKGCEVVAVFG